MSQFPCLATNNANKLAFDAIFLTDKELEHKDTTLVSILVALMSFVYPSKLSSFILLKGFVGVYTSVLLFHIIEEKLRANSLLSLFTPFLLVCIYTSWES